MQLEELSEDTLIDMHEEGHCEEKDEHVLEEVTEAKDLHINVTLRNIAWHWHAKGKMLEGDRNLEKNMTICQDIKKMLALNLVIQWEGKYCSNYSWFIFCKTPRHFYSQSF